VRKILHIRKRFMWLRNANWITIGVVKFYEIVQTNSKHVFALLFDRVHSDNFTAFMSLYYVLRIVIDFTFCCDPLGLL